MSETHHTSSDTTSSSPGLPGKDQQLAEQVVKIYEDLRPDNLEALRSIYTPDIYFEDPAHGIQGITALLNYFEALFANVEQCQFSFHQIQAKDGHIFLSWTMLVVHKRLKKGRSIRVEGASHLKTREGQVYYHRDYFDLGAMVYENVPLLGGIIRIIKERLAQ